MPRNRQGIPREERVVAIVDVAAELFADRGFDDVAMTEIASRSGIRSGAVYWYFESKDHVLAAVLRRLAERTAAAHAEPVALPPGERLLHYLRELRPLRMIHASAHARLSSSAVVAEAHDLLLDQLRTLIGEALDGIPLGEREVIGDLVIAAFEGANQPGYHGTSATDLVAAVLELANRPVNEHTK